MKKIVLFTIIFVFSILILIGFSASGDSTRLPENSLKAITNPSAQIGQRETYPLNPKLKKIGEIPKVEVYVRLIFTNEELGWLAGDTEIWKTENRGKTWTLIYSLNEKSWDRISDIVFIDPLNGWLITENVYRSIDGGHSWKEDDFFSEKFKGTIGTFDTVYFSQKAKTIFVGTGEDRNASEPVERAIFAYQKAIYKSNSENIRWEKASFPSAFPDGAGAVKKIAFADDLNGIAIGELNHDIYVTANGGKSWKKSSLNSRCTGRDLINGNESKPIAITVASGGKAWIGYDDGRIIKSEDFGGNWCDLALPTQIWKKEDKGLAYFKKFYFLSDKRGWGVKVNGDLFETTNGGSSWTLIDSQIDFKDIVVTGEKCMFVSENGIFEIQD